ncbi:MAG: uracil-DNA glycosylase family protein [Actinomycetota bacterium]
MERDTVRIYEERGAAWAARRQPVRRADAVAFGARVPPGRPRADLGCGAGRYTADLGLPVVALDAAWTMLGLLRGVVPAAWPVMGDLEALPLRRSALCGAWANMSYLHVPRVRLPLALAELHRATRPGAPFDLQVLVGDYEGTALARDDLGGRFFSAWAPEALRDVLTGAGFRVDALAVEGEVVRTGGERLRTLADTVGPGMRLLVCGLNPSEYAADRGAGYARPGNRFWPAAMDAGLVTRDRDPRHALVAHGVGMTDLVKRATRDAGALTPEEYAIGAERVRRLVEWLEPSAVCFVGLDGYRSAVDRSARAGAQSEGFGGRPAYVMPSTSGRNAHATRGELAAHLAAAARLGGS